MPEKSPHRSCRAVGACSLRNLDVGSRRRVALLAGEGGQGDPRLCQDLFHLGQGRGICLGGAERGRKLVPQCHRFVPEGLLLGGWCVAVVATKGAEGMVMAAKATVWSTKGTVKRKSHTVLFSIRVCSRYIVLPIRYIFLRRMSRYIEVSFVKKQ